MECDFILYLFHILGERIKECGIDTISRSCPIEGVVRGEKILSFLPLHNSAVERSGGLLSWIR